MLLGFDEMRLRTLVEHADGSVTTMEALTDGPEWVSMGVTAARIETAYQRYIHSG